MSADKPLEVRFELLEQKVAGQGRTLEDVVRGLGDIKEILAKTPPSTSSREKLALVGGTASIIVAFMALANGWLDSRLAPDRLTLSRIERQTEAYPVVAYRVDELEKRISKLLEAPRQAPAP